MMHHWYNIFDTFISREAIKNEHNHPINHHYKFILNVL